MDICSKIKSVIKLNEAILSEGRHWPEDYRTLAFNRIKNSPIGNTFWYTDEYIQTDTNTFINEFDALAHDNKAISYFLHIIRMFIDYSGTNPRKYVEFIERKLDTLILVLSIILNDPELLSKHGEKIKNENYTIEQFEKDTQYILAELERNDAELLKSVPDKNTGDYVIKHIPTYQDFYKNFGGDKTGYQGRSEWCHANGKSTYDSWTEKGTKQFFVLAKKGWENIMPPDPKTTNAFDEYGTSLIAILVKVDGCALKNATLRWNHVIPPSITVPKTSVDHAFLGWGELSRAVGFNVKNDIQQILNRLA